MHSFELSGIGFGGLGLFALAYGIFVVLLHIIMAMAVTSDARRLETTTAGLFLLAPLLWGGITLVFGLAGLAAYWAIHHSVLRPTAPPHDRV